MAVRLQLSDKQWAKVEVFLEADYSVGEPGKDDRTDVDDEWHSLDATINRAHQHAAGGKGGRKRTRSAAREGDPRPKFISSSMR